MFSSFTFQPATTAVDDWATVEFRGLTLGDKRLEDRAIATVQTLAGQATESIPAAGQTAADIKAIYRFFDNPKVTVPALLAPHLRQTQQRIRQHPVVLLIHDITELNYTGKLVADQLGWIADNKTRGIFFDPLLALTPDRVPLGLVDTHTWLRATPQGTARDRKHWPIECKETYCWLRGYRQACALAAKVPRTTLVYVADRGGDIYELYHEAATRRAAAHAEFVIRGCDYDRCLTPQDADGAAQQAHLTAQLATQPVLGQLTFEVPATAERPARTVTQQVRAAAVQLQAPYRKAGALAPVRVHAMLLTECDPPAGQPSVSWLLYTSLPIGTLAEVEAVLSYYCARWDIELYFKVLKSGCTVEQLYLQTPERLMNALALYWLIAWRILYCTRLGRACPTLPCTVVFSAAEWQAAHLIFYDTLPERPPTLHEMIHLVARCGGFVGRAGDGEPGIKTVWLGLRRTQDYALAYQRFGPGRRKKTPARQ